MRDEMGVTFPLFSDPELTVIRSWGLLDTSAQISVPATFVVDSDNVIRFAHVGDDKADRPVVQDVISVLRYFQP